MEDFGHRLTEIGLMIIPYSFAIYFPYRFLEHLLQMGSSKIVKAIWYFALGLGYLTNSYEVDYVVMFICFIEAWDLMFEQLETQRKRKLRSK